MPRTRPNKKRDELDRLPPHSEAMERGTLACVLLDPKASMTECVARFKDNPEVFYDERHQTIYRALVDMWNEQKPIEPATLVQWLTDRAQLENAGGLLYLMELPDAAPSAANLSSYLGTVWEKYLLRRTLQTFADKTRRIQDFEGNVEELLDEVEADILKINQGRGIQEIRSLPLLVEANAVLLENLKRGVGLIGGVRTHLGYFDKMTGGLHRKEMAVLAGRPSTGKTSLAVTILMNVAKRGKLPCAFFSMEMSAEDIVLRMMCAEAQVNFHKIRTGFPEKGDKEREIPGDIDKLAAVAPTIARLPITIDDTPALGILELRAKARRLKMQKDIQLIAVDYLQLMHGSRDYNGNRALEVAEISGGLKSLAKELNVPILVLSQLNRELERQKNRKPQLSDLRESGAIEQDADLAALLYRPRTKDEEEDDGDAPVIPVKAHIAKQRNGPCGDVEFLFRREWMWFEDAYQNTGTKPPENPGISAVLK